MIYLNNVAEEDEKVTQKVSSDDSSVKDYTTSTDKDSVKKQEQEKDIKPIDISLNNILILLHKRSKQELEKEGVIIYNGSFDEKEDKCKYLGPGTYFIRLMKMEGNELPDKNKAAELISKYIKRFSNNDIKINPDQLTEVLENSENTDEKTSVSESLLYSLFSEADEQPKQGAKKTEDTDGKEGESTNKSSDSEVSQENKVIGYMISYTNAYGKDKGKRISWGNALIDKLFGNTIRDLQSLKFKYRDTTINAGKMFKKETYIDNVINANTIEGELGKIINHDYPKNKVDVNVYTGKAVYNKLSKLNKRLEQKDSEKLGKNPYCITFTVDKKDPNYDQYSKDVFAGIISRVIGKQFNIMPGNRGNVGEKDIIYVPQFTMDSSSDKMKQELSQLYRIFNSKNNSKQKETTTNESFSFSLDDKLLKFLFEDNDLKCSDFIMESGRHTSAHINELIDKYGSKYIKANKEKILNNIKSSYTGKGEADDIRSEMIGVKEKSKTIEWDKKRIDGWNKKHPDDKREKGYTEKQVIRAAKPGKLDDFFNQTTNEQMKKWVDDNFGSISKSDDGEKFVQAFWKALSLLPEEKDQPKQPEQPQPPLPPEPESPKKVKVEFIDDGPDTEFDEDNPEEIPEPNIIKEQEIDIGSSAEPPPDPTHEGYEFIGWMPNIKGRNINDFSNIEQNMFFSAKYKGFESQKFIVKFYYTDNGENKDIGEEQIVKKGESAKAPEPPELEGYTFKQWENDEWKNVNGNLNIKAIYEPDEVGNFIFRKFKDDNQIKDYINVKNGSDENKETTDNFKKIADFIESLEIISDDQQIGSEDLKIPEIDKTIGYYEFISWEPDPNEIKPQKDNINIVPIYKSKDKDNPESTSVENVGNNEDNSYFEHDVYIFSDPRIKYENENKQEKEFKNDGTFKTKEEPWISSK